MLMQDHLVLKRPEARVQALISSGEGLPFSTTRDRRAMRQWVSMKPEQGGWPDLAQEALGFAASQDGTATPARTRRAR